MASLKANRRYFSLHEIGNLYKEVREGQRLKLENPGMRFHSTEFAREIVASQVSRLSPQAIVSSMQSTGIRPEETKRAPLIMLLGFNGRIARKFRTAGFRIFFSDLIEGWAKRGQKKGFPSFVEDSLHPATNPKKVLGYVLFQPFPIFQGFWRKTKQRRKAFEHMLESPKGIVFIDSLEIQHRSSYLLQEKLKKDYGKSDRYRLQITPIPGSKGPAGETLALFHIQKNI